MAADNDKCHYLDLHSCKCNLDLCRTTSKLVLNLAFYLKCVVEIRDISFAWLALLLTLGQKPTFNPEITKNLMFEKCELCEKWDFENVNFEKSEILKM